MVELERSLFAVWTSTLGEAELRAGSFPRQSDCLRMIRKLRYLPVTATVQELIEEIMRRKLVPPNKTGDAAHLAIAAAHRMDFC